MNNQPKVVLVTEDEAPMLRVLTDKLSENGLETIQARDGREGLMIALAKHPDLILLDVLMPNMDGFTMLKKLRLDPWGKNVPVIMLTNLNAETDETIQSIVNSQPSFYFVKSDVKLDDIVQKIKELLFNS